MDEATYWLKHFFHRELFLQLSARNMSIPRAYRLLAFKGPHSCTENQTTTFLLMQPAPDSPAALASWDSQDLARDSTNCLLERNRVSVAGRPRDSGKGDNWQQAASAARKVLQHALGQETAAGWGTAGTQGLYSGCSVVPEHNWDGDPAASGYLCQLSSGSQKTD